MRNALLSHLDTLTTEGRKALAERVGTTPAGLHQLAHAYRTRGSLSLTADMASRIDQATNGAVRREECCVACGRCELASLARRGSMGAGEDQGCP